MSFWFGELVVTILDSTVFLCHICVDQSSVLNRILVQVYDDQVEANVEDLHGRKLLSELPSRADAELDKRQSIRIFLNYDAVGHSTDRDCHFVHDVVKVNE